MKVKNQSAVSSELDAKEKLIVYVYEYLTRSGAKRAAQAFLEDIQYDKSIAMNSVDGPGFLANWWCVFWDLYCAAPDKRSGTHAEASSEARAFIEYSTRPMMSPHHLHQTPPPPQPPYMNAGPRYGPPPGPQSGPMRHHGPPPPPPMNVGPPPPSRMHMGQPLPPPHPHGHPPPPMSNGPHHGPPPPMMGGAPSPRYAPHQGHMTSISHGPEPGPSPGLVNRMTPNHSGSPHPQVMGGQPPQGPPPPQHGGMHSSVGPPMQQTGPPPSAQMQQQRVNSGPSAGAGWQGGYGSPADQCFMPGPPMSSGQPPEFDPMMMNDGSSMMEMKPTPGGAGNSNAPIANPQQDDYVIPGAYGQQSDQSGDAGSEIRKLKESLESDANEGDQAGFNMDYPDQQGKW